MAEPGVGEGQPQQQIPDQETKEERIEKAVNALAESARYLASLGRSASPEEINIERIRYRSEDRTKAVMLWRNYFEHPDYIRSLPLEIKKYENVVPLWAQFAHQSEDNSWHQDENKLWVVLSKTDPKVIQLIDENGRPSYPDNEKWAEGVTLTGRERFKDRTEELLPPIVDAVLGKKIIDRSRSRGSDYGFESSEQSSTPPKK